MRAVDLPEFIAPYLKNNFAILKTPYFLVFLIIENILRILKDNKKNQETYLNEILGRNS